MKGLSSIIVYLMAVFVLIVIIQTKDDIAYVDNEQGSYYDDSFTSAVADTSSEIADFTAQQIVNPLRYDKEKEVAITEQSLSVFYDNLASKFNIQGNTDELQDLIMHIPASVIVGYRGFKIVTLDPKGFVGGGDFKPYIWPERPYTYKLNNGSLLYFRLDQTATLYDPATNQYLEGDFNQLRSIRNLAPLNDESSFNEAKVESISKSIERALGSAVNRHTVLVKSMGLKVDFGLPKDFTSITIDHVGFYSFIQGYPLPGGEVLSTFAFSGGNVRVNTLYYGVSDGSGKLWAINSRCGVPSGYQQLETFRSEKEAASKGYFPQLCVK